MAAALPTGIHKIPLPQLTPSPYNARKIRTTARIEEVARSLAEHGQREPITTYPGTGKEAGKYLIVSGVTRYFAALSLGLETLDAWVDEKLASANDLALVETSRTHNEANRETDLDRAFLARMLLDAGHTTEKIARVLGYGSRRSVHRLQTYFGLPVSMLEQGCAEPEKFSAPLAEMLKNAIEVKGIAEEKARTFLARRFTENLSLRQVDNLIRAEERKLQRNAGQLPWRAHAFDIHLEGSKVGQLDVWEMPGQKQKVHFSALLDRKTGEWLNTQLTEFFERFMEEAGKRKQKMKAENRKPSSLPREDRQTCKPKRKLKIVSH